MLFFILVFLGILIGTILGLIMLLIVDNPNRIIYYFKGRK